MSERDGYEPGVPCWVDTWQPDPDAAAAFYAELFGWDPHKPPPGSTPEYVMAKLRGRDVAAIGAPPPPVAPAAAWTTYIWVDDVDATAAKVSEAGGEVLDGPFDSLDGGRMAIVADPAGAVFGVWRPGAHKGAQLVNEPGAWSMSMLHTPDPEGAKPFYGAVFGWTTEAFEIPGGEMTMWRLPGFVGGEPEQPVSREVVAVMGASSGDEPPRWSVDFWIGDADAAAATTDRLGGKVLAGPYEAPPFRQAVLADPQGAGFTVSQLMVP